MTHLTRIASAGQRNPLPLPETADLTPEQRSEYTFVLTKNADDGSDDYLITETAAREISPLIEHMGVGDVYYVLGT